MKELICIYLIILFLVVLLFGAAIGSALKCYIDRKKEKKSWFNGRSSCPICKKTLQWYELIPFFSYIALRGKCLKCKSKIPLSCLIYEAVFGLVFEMVILFVLKGVFVW